MICIVLVKRNRNSLQEHFDFKLIVQRQKQGANKRRTTLKDMLCMHMCIPDVGG